MSIDDEWNINAIPEHEQKANNFILGVRNLSRDYPDFSVTTTTIADELKEQADRYSHIPYLNTQSARLERDLEELDRLSANETNIVVLITSETHRSRGDELISKVQDSATENDGKNITTYYLYTEVGQEVHLNVTLGFVF